jgi:CBS domain containing-hemolysin-like protein
MIFLLIIVTILITAFFSGYEIAFISANKLKIELNKKQGDLSGKILGKFFKQPSHFIGTILVGNNIALIFYSILMSNLLDKPIENWLLQYTKHADGLTMLCSTLISAIVILIFGEFLPKAFFRLNPNQFLSWFSIPFLGIYWLLSPIASLFANLAKWLLAITIGLKLEEKKPVFERSDLEHFIKQTQPQEEHNQEINTDLFENALYLTQVKVRECMVPRTEVEYVDIADSINILKDKFLETKLSRLLIIDDEIDNVLGYVHHQDLLKSPTSIRSILKQIPPVPESMQAVDLMNLLMKTHKSIAWVVDEFGGTAGLVTLEDVLEEIFGEIKDEHDAAEELVEKQISEDEFIFSGRIEIDYINEKYELNIPHGDYETLAGYIVANHENIPEQDEHLNIDNFEIDILMVSETKIETVKLKVLPLE